LNVRGMPVSIKFDYNEGGKMPEILNNKKFHSI
jgi:capsid portal protein